VHELLSVFMFLYINTRMHVFALYRPIIHENVWYNVTCKPCARLTFRYGVPCKHITA